MLKLLEQSLTSFNSNDYHVRCMAHIINLCAQQFLSHLYIMAGDKDNDGSAQAIKVENRIPNIFWQARKIISKIRASNLLWESFEGQTSAAKLPPLKLFLDMRVW